jgi:hypothetical protein
MITFRSEISAGRKDFLPVEPQSGLSFLFLLGTPKVRLRPLLFPSVWPSSPDVHPPLAGGLSSARVPSHSSRLLPFQAFFRGAQLSASLSARKICHSNFSRSKANSKILPPNLPRLTVPRSKKGSLRSLNSFCPLSHALRLFGCQLASNGRGYVTGGTSIDHHR